MRSKRKRFDAGRMSLKAFAVTMVMGFFIQETVLSVMAEISTTVPEDLVTVIEDDQAESYDDDDLIRVTSTPRMAVSSMAAGRMTVKMESKKPEVVEKVTEKAPEKLMTTKAPTDMRTIARTKPPDSVTTVSGTLTARTSTSSVPPTFVNTAGITLPLEDSRITKTVLATTSPDAVDESTEITRTVKKTNAITRWETTDRMTTGYTLMQNLPLTAAETTTMEDFVLATGNVPTSRFPASSSVVPSTSVLGSPSTATVSPSLVTVLPPSSPAPPTSPLSSQSPSSSPGQSSPVFPSPSPPSSTRETSTSMYIAMTTTASHGSNTGKATTLSTDIYMTTNASHNHSSRQTRQTTTSSMEEKCETYTFEPNNFAYFIQTRDTEQGTFTRFEMSARGVFGGDEWNQSVTVEEEDTYVNVDLGNGLIPGEIYEVIRRWCNSDTCPETGKCPYLNITKDVQAKDMDVDKVEPNTTSASVMWRVDSREAYIPEITVALSLTNEMWPPVERIVPTKRSSVYSTTGSFVLDNLASGARYLLKFVFANDRNGSNNSETEFVTVPATPENLTFDKLNYNTVNVSWHQQYYRDNFTITFGTHNSTFVTSQIHDDYFVLDNLTQGIVYNISVTAQTGNEFSDPAKMILELKPPSIDLDVLQILTSSVSIKMTTTENIDYVGVMVDGSPFRNFSDVHGEKEFNITSLTPGTGYSLKLKARIREFDWRELKTIATKPLPPENLSIDNSNYGRLEVCWNSPSFGGFDSFNVQFRYSSQRAAFQMTVNETQCYSQSVRAGAVYTVSVATLSNELQSEQSTEKALARPSFPAIQETAKTTTSVTIAVSCPPANYFHHVNVAFCGRSNFNCSQSVINCNGDKEEVLTEDSLIPGNRYYFEALSVQVADDDLRAVSDVVYHRTTTYPLPPTDLSVIKKSGLEIVIQWKSTCFTCNYSIEAVPHNRYIETSSWNSTCYDSIEYDAYRLCEYSLVIPREQLHDITVKTLSWGERSLTGVTLANISMPKVTKHVTEIELTPLSPSLVSVTFKPPEVPHEQITSYEINYQGIRESGEVCSPQKRNLPADQPLPINVTVKGGCLYEFSIKAFFGKIEGEEATERVNTTVGAPVAKNTIPSYPDRSTFTPQGFEVIFDPLMFSDENGALLYFTVIVAEAPDGIHSALVQLNASLPGWAESIQENPIPPYQILPMMQVTNNVDQSTSGGTSKRSVVVLQPVMVGNESCAYTNEKYCNGPLIGGRNYIYWFRGFTSAGYADTPPSQQFPLPQNQSNLIITCLIILMILFIIVIILIVLLLRKRLRMDNKGDYQPAPTDSVILKSMTKNSSRAKYIRAVKLTEFCQDFHVMSAHSNFGYSQEFENLRRVGKKMTTYDAVLPENVSKNRYTNILPYDKTRVKLGSIDDELGSDYINANWIPGFSSPREYIACQGPLPGTVDDMWRMVWENNVSLVVMVTQLVEKGKVKCDQYWPEDHKPVYYGDIQVTMTQITETESWNMKEFTLYKPYVDQRKKVKHFNYLSWPDHGVPENSESLLNFIEVIRQQSPKNGSPTIVHCSAGCGRTGTYICLDRLLQQIEEFDYVNILGTVADMRAHRQHMVQTEQQYVFIHRCVLDILEERGIAPKPSSTPMNGNTGGALLFGVIV